MTVTPIPETGLAIAPEFAPPDALVVRYAEIFLKGENRRTFEDVLVHNVQRALDGVPGAGSLRVRRHHGRLVVQAEGHAGGASGGAADRGATANASALEAALPAVLTVFGVSSASLALTVPKDLARIAARGAGVLVTAARAGVAHSFKVQSRRSDKHFAHGSATLNDVVGAAGRIASGLAVDVRNPDLTLTVEIGPELSFVSAHHAKGPGGLPVGVSGNVTLLLSGGIDSPVAGWLCQKRGCRLNAVYFHAAPYTGDGTRRKVLELARLLGRTQGGMRVTVVPFAEFQEACRDQASPRLLVVLYRRAMARLAERVAQAEDSLALATGENLGQVASQTISNLAAIEAAVALPMFRPVLTYDKNEIIDVARKIGTFDTSTLPFDDCCSLFVPRHPSTRARAQEAERAESSLANYAALLDAAFARREIVDLDG